MTPSLLLGLALAVGEPSAKEDPKRAASLEGEWAAEKWVEGGRERTRAIWFKFGPDGKVAVRAGDKKNPEQGSFKVDAKKNPAEIDIVSPEGSKNPPVLGIYKVDGDTLTLCIVKGGPDTKRPTSFESPRGSQGSVFTLKRVKKDSRGP